MQPGSRRARLVPTVALAVGLAACDSGRVSEPEPGRPPGAASARSATDSLRDVSGARYLERVTGGAEGEAPLRLVVALHGLGDSPAGFAPLFADLDARARVVVVQGFDVWGDGRSWFPFRPDASAADRAAAIATAADRLAPVIATLRSQRPTRGLPIVTGFSQGGMLSFALAVRHPGAFAAALPIGGALPEPLWPPAGPGPWPALVAFHGEADARVPLAPTQQAVLALRARGLAVELHAYPGLGHGIDARLRRDWLAELSRRIASNP